MLTETRRDEDSAAAAETSARLDDEAAVTALPDSPNRPLQDEGSASPPPALDSTIGSESSGFEASDGTNNHPAEEAGAKKALELPNERSAQQPNGGKEQVTVPLVDVTTGKPDEEATEQLDDEPAANLAQSDVDPVVKVLVCDEAAAKPDDEAAAKLAEGAAPAAKLDDDAMPTEKQDEVAVVTVEKPVEEAETKLDEEEAAGKQVEEAAAKLDKGAAAATKTDDAAAKPDEAAEAKPKEEAATTEKTDEAAAANTDEEAEVQPDEEAVAKLDEEEVAKSADKSGANPDGGVAAKRNGVVKPDEEAEAVAAAAANPDDKEALGKPVEEKAAKSNEVKATTAKMDDQTAAKPDEEAEAKLDEEAVAKPADKAGTKPSKGAAPNLDAEAGAKPDEDAEAVAKPDGEAVVKTNDEPNESHCPISDTASISDPLTLDSESQSEASDESNKPPTGTGIKILEPNECSAEQPTSINEDVGENGRHRAVKAASVVCRLFLLLDPRAIALFRIGLALCSLIEWHVAFASREAFLHGDGMMPRKAWFNETKGDVYNEAGINIWMAVWSDEAVLTMLILQLLFSVGLLVGYYSCVCSFVVFLFINSWNMILGTKMGGGIEVLAVFLLWGAWLPLGDSYSLDALGDTNKPGGDRASGAVERATELFVTLRDHIASVGIPLHMTAMYYACGVVKESEHWNSGHAVLMVVNYGMMTNQPFGSIMAKLPSLCRFMTKATYYLETYGGFFLLIPSSTVRLVSLAVLLLFHLGMHLSLDVGTFQPTMMSALVLLTPAQGCDIVEKGIHAIWTRKPLLHSTTWMQGIVPLRGGRQSSKTVFSCLGAFFVATMVLLMTFSTTNDLCVFTSRITRGKYTCWLGHGRNFRPSLHRWFVLLGMPQYHGPFRGIDTDSFYHHLVGIVDCDSNSDKNKDCETGKKTVAVFTDKTTSQLNFDDRVLWSPDQEPHGSIQWYKYFHSSGTHRKGSYKNLADHICRKWNKRSGYPKLRSLANVRIWREMMPRKYGTLEFSPHKYTINSHLKCSDHGHSGLASDATLIANKMEKVLGIDHMEVSLMNNAHYPLVVFWVNTKTGKEILKGQVRERSRWTQRAKMGHTFKFYWDLPGVPAGSHEKKGLLAEVIRTGQAENNIVLEPTSDWRIKLKNNARYPLLVYWVHHDTGSEIPKGRAHQGIFWWQTAKLGHKFRFYWDVKNGQKVLAQEARVEADNRTIVINEPKKIWIQNTARFPLLLYWVHSGTGEEMAKGGVAANSSIDQDTKVGHVFRLYWDLPDVNRTLYQEERLLAREFAVSSSVDEIAVGDRSEWV